MSGGKMTPGKTPVFVPKTTLQKLKLKGIFSVDNTIRKQAGKALLQNRQHNKFLANIIETSSQPFAVAYSDGRFSLINGAFERLTGYSADELAHIGWLTGLTPLEWQEIERQKLEELNQTGLPVHYEKEYMRKDGSRVPVELLVHRVNDAKGNPYYYSFITDITERKQTEQALRTSEEKLRLFFEHTPAAIAMFDREMRYIHASRRWLKDYGLGDRNIIGHSHYDVFPEISERWKQIHKRCLAGAVERRDEDLFPRQDGTTDWVSWEVLPWYESSSAIGGIIMATEVISFKKRAVDALRESEEKFRALFEQAGDNVFILDPTPVGGPVILDANQSACRMHGFTHEELVGKPISTLDDEENKLLVAERTARILTGERVIFETVHNRKDGSRFPVEVCAMRVDLAERPPLVFTIERDITERKQTEERLRKLTQRLNYHIENSPLGVIEFGADMRLIRWSGAAERIFGWKAEEVLGKRLEDFRWVYEEDKAQVDEVSSELQEGKNLRRFSANRNYRKDGSVAWCEWYNSSFLDESSNLRSILSLVLDVTDRKRLEDSLQQNRVMLESRVEERTAELREKDRLLLQQNRLAAMGEMINNIAHQWRQPLNALGLNIQRLLLFYNMGNFDKDFLQTSTEDAMKMILHMSQTIDDFRNFFKSDKDKIDFSVNQAVQQTVKLVEDSFKNNHIQIINQASDEIFANGYPNEFSQAILNIMQNARDALVEQKVSEGLVTVKVSVENSRAIVKISDNAGGIPKEIIDKIFDPYFSTKGVHGTGIGLYMSKNIIENNMGGKIAVRNIPGGAEFRIEI